MGEITGGIVMTGRGRSEPRGRNLFVEFDDKDWRIMICRRDGESCDRFGEHHGRTIITDMLRKFIPNLDALAWVPNSAFRSRALCAKDGEFEIRLLIAKGSSLSDDQIIGEFKEAMAGTQKV